MIGKEQFLHYGRPEWRGRLYRERVAHRPSLKISGPDSHRVFLVEADRPGVPKTAARTGLRRYPFFESERRPCAKALSARFIITQDIGDDIGRFGRSDPVDHGILGGKKFRPHGQPTSRESGVGGGKIGQADLGVAQNETRTIVREGSGKVESPFLQFMKGGTRA